MIYVCSREFATNCETRYTVSSPFTRKYARKGRTMIIPNEDKGLGKRRHAMPQLADFAAFKKDLDDNDIALVDIRIPAEELAPTQGNFNEEKVEFLRKQKKKGKPIITSNDDYVIDGHHRWLAAAQDGEEIDCRVVDLTADELLAFLKGKDYVEFKALKEAELTPGLQKVQDYYMRAAKIEGGQVFAQTLNRVMELRSKLESNKDATIKKRSQILRYIEQISELVK